MVFWFFGYFSKNHQNFWFLENPKTLVFGFLEIPKVLGVWFFGFLDFSIFLFQRSPARSKTLGHYFWIFGCFGFFGFFGFLDFLVFGVFRPLAQPSPAHFSPAQPTCSAQLSLAWAIQKFQNFWIFWFFGVFGYSSAALPGPKP